MSDFVTPKRGLSGIYVRAQDENGKWGNAVFEDLTEEKQKEYLEGKDPQWVMNMALALAKSLRSVGDQLDIAVEGAED